MTTTTKVTITANNNFNNEAETIRYRTIKDFNSSKDFYDFLIKQETNNHNMTKSYLEKFASEFEPGDISIPSIQESFIVHTLKLIYEIEDDYKNEKSNSFKQD